MTPGVLFVTGQLGRGGAELAVVALARGLAARGRYRPALALLGEGGELGRALVAEGIPLTELGIRGPIRNPGAIRRLFRLTRALRAFRPTLLQTFLFDADFYGMLAGRLGGPRAVITTRRALKDRKRHHLRGYRLTNGLVARIVANSEVVRRYTIDNEGVAPEKVLAIPNGVDLARFEGRDPTPWRARLGVPTGGLLVGSLGNLKPVKGQDVLLEAMLPLLAARPGLVLTLAGGADTDFARALAEKARAAGVGARVHFLGSVEDVPGFLAALDVFVLPSRSEGMSNALLEAMAASRPIVATRVGGNAENLDEGRVGRVVESEEPEAMRAALAGLLDGEEERRRLGRAARERAEREYSLARMLERYESLYDELFGKESP